MSETKTVLIPSLALNYENNLLESVGVSGELYRRETPLSAENSRLKAENAKLRELVRDYHSFLALAELVQPIDYVIGAKGSTTLSVAKLDQRYRALESDGE